MSLPKFYVGQRVVAVKNHHRSLFKKGDEFTILAVKESTCKCAGFNVDVGIKADSCWFQCVDCKTIVYQRNTSWLIDQDDFAPIVENFQAITFEKVIEKELASVN